MCTPTHTCTHRHSSNFGHVYCLCKQDVLWRIVCSSVMHNKIFYLEISWKFFWLVSTVHFLPCRKQYVFTLKTNHLMLWGKNNCRLFPESYKQICPVGSVLHLLMLWWVVHRVAYCHERITSSWNFILNGTKKIHLYEAPWPVKTK